jgi:hypothetical protein
MFQDNGNWKEFGFSNDAKHTLFPFWMYCVSSALISYALSYFIYSFFDENENVSEEVEINIKPKKENSSLRKKGQMKSGYYVLDKETYENEGIPKYIFLGEEAPNNNIE